MESRAEPPESQDHGPGEEAQQTQGPPDPLVSPVFPQRRLEQQEPSQAPETASLLRPPPGGLTKSPEELTRQVGWAALTHAVAESAKALYPNDPQAVALTVANSLQPYISAFASRGSGLTSGTAHQGPSTTPLSKTTEALC